MPKLSFLFVAVLLQSAPPQDSVEVAVQPPNPRQGSVVTIIVAPAEVVPVTDVRGRFAGEVLHFERAGSQFRALAGIPVTDSGEVEFPLVLHFEDETTRQITASFAVRDGNYGVDTLSVSSTFSDPLTAGQRERIRVERDLSRQLTPVVHETPRMWTRPFLRPKGGRVTSGYGRARVFNGEIRSRHMGVDIDGETGEPVRVANDGVVALVGDFFYSGNIIYVNHGGGLLTAYLHLSRTAVAEGDTVMRGQVIGYVGQTGRVTGPHLHWAARYGDVSVNALTLLDIDQTDLPRSADE